MESYKIEKILDEIEKDFKVNKAFLITPKTEDEAVALYNEIKGINISKDYYKFSDFLNDKCIDDPEIEDFINKPEVYSKKELQGIWGLHKEEYIRYCQRNGYAFENYGM